MSIETIIFDLDGTLYEDERVYDRYAQELARFLPPARRRQYLADWTAARAGHGPARVGMGYDAKRDRLFRFTPDRIQVFLDWEGEKEAVPAEEQAAPHPGEPAAGPPIETEIFGPDRRYIGDWWGLPDVLAAHHGVRPQDRAAAFLATRAYMGSPDFRLTPEPWLRDLLSDLLAQGLRLIAMSNSPASSVEEVLAQLDLADRFDLVVPDAAKPAGLARFLAETHPAERVLSVGDHFINDIAPALRVGGSALYIDRHGTGLGHGLTRSRRISSRQSLPAGLKDLEPERFAVQPGPGVLE